MGTSQSRPTDPTLLFQQNYHFIHKTIHPLFGAISLYKAKHTLDQVMVKEITTNTIQDLQDTKARYQEALVRNHESILNLVHFHQQEAKTFCGSHYITYCVFEYFPKDFSQEWLERQQKQSRLEEKQMMVLTNSLVSGLAFLEKRDRPTQVSFCSILMNNAYQYKITDPEFFPQEMVYHQLLLSTGPIQQEHLLSPEAMLSLQQKQMEPTYDQHKSNVFSLGMLLLQAGLLISLRDLYDYKAGILHYHRLAPLLNDFARLYSANLTNLVKLCLVQEVSQRKNFIQMLDFLESKRLYDMNRDALGDSEFFSDNIKASQMNSHNKSLRTQYFNRHQIKDTIQEIPQENIVEPLPSIQQPLHPPVSPQQLYSPSENIPDSKANSSFKKAAPPPLQLDSPQAKPCSSLNRPGLSDSLFQTVQLSPPADDQFSHGHQNNQIDHHQNNQIDHHLISSNEPIDFQVSDPSKISKQADLHLGHLQDDLAMLYEQFRVADLNQNGPQQNSVRDSHFSNYYSANLYQSNQFASGMTSVPPDVPPQHSSHPQNYDSLQQQDSIFKKCANGWVNQLEQFQQDGHIGPAYESVTKQDFPFDAHRMGDVFTPMEQQYPSNQQYLAPSGQPLFQTLSKLQHNLDLLPRQPQPYRGSP